MEDEGRTGDDERDDHEDEDEDCLEWVWFGIGLGLGFAFNFCFSCWFSWVCLRVWFNFWVGLVEIILLAEQASSSKFQFLMQ